MSHGLTEWESEEIGRDTKHVDRKRLELLLRETKTTLNHARVFISTREKMHPAGIVLYDELISQIEQVLVEVELARQRHAETGQIVQVVDLKREIK